MTAPSTRDIERNLLVEYAFAVGGDIFEVDRALPVHVLVTLVVDAASCDAVGTVALYTYGVVVQILIVRHYRDDW